jgi:hypothetical protein
VVRAVARGFGLGRRGYLALSFETVLSRIVAAVHSHRGAVNQHAIYAEIYHVSGQHALPTRSS